MTHPRSPQQNQGHQPYGPLPQQRTYRPAPRPHSHGHQPYGPPPQQLRPPAPQHSSRPLPRPHDLDPQTHELPVQRSYEPTPRASHRQAESRNGLGLAAAIVGPIGILFGLVPLTGFVAVICGLVAIPLALVGRSRYKKGLATNGRTAMAGLLSGVVALALGIWGIVIVFQATDRLVDELSGPSPVSTGPVVGDSGAPGQAPAASTGVAAFGQRVTFDDGVAVEVTTPQPFVPSRYAAGNERERAVSFEVTIINGSDQPLDAVAAFVRATHAGRDAPMIFDSEKGVNGAAQGTVLPGKSITFPIAVSIGKDVAELQVDVSPGFLGDPAIFSGQI